MRDRFGATGDIGGVQVSPVRFTACLGDEIDRVFDLAIGAAGNSAIASPPHRNVAGESAVPPW